MLCKLKFVKKLDCRLFIPCSNLIGYVTHVAAKFINWASWTYQFIKAAITSMASNPVKSNKSTLNTCTLDKARPCQFAGSEDVLDRR